MITLKCDHNDEMLIPFKLIEENDDGEVLKVCVILACKSCGTKSQRVISEKMPDEPYYNADGSRFGAAYTELTKREWYTQSDDQQVNFLEKNPTVFWAYPPTNAKYLVLRVPSELEKQLLIDEAYRQRNEAYRILREKTSNLQETQKQCGRPPKYFRPGE